jgi:hypothetical protein
VSGALGAAMMPPAREADDRASIAIGPLLTPGRPTPVV